MTRTFQSHQPQAQDRAGGMGIGRYAMLGLLCAAAAIAYVQRSAIAVPEGLMETDLRLDKVRFGTVMSMWLLWYALAQIPSGWLGDKWGTRNTLTLYALLWSAATGLVGAARGYGSLLVIWSLMGIAQAGLFPCAARAVKRAFPEAQRASATGLLATFMGIGGAIAPMLTGILLTAFSWRWVFLIFSLPGVAWAAVFFRWLRPGRTGAAEPAGLPIVQSPPPAGSLIAAPSTIFTMLGSASMWLLCAQQFLRASAMIFFSTWFPTFLRESRHVTVMRSGLLTAMAGIGAVFGCLLGGFTSDAILAMTARKRLSRQGIAVLGMTTCAALIVGAYFIHNTTLAVGVIGAGAFCATFGGVSGYTVAMDFGGRRVATVFSVMNMCGNIGAAAFPLLIGWLVKQSGSWNMVLFIFAGIFAVDAIFWALLNPKRPLFDEE